MNAENASYFKTVQIACLQAYPRLVLVDEDIETYTGPDMLSFPPEIEREVEAYYQRYFREEMSVGDMIIMLSRSKTSDNPQDRDFFACMLHYLFDEYRFLKNEYPQKAVEETGTLLGCIIGYDLVTYIPLGVALRYILEALQESSDSKMFQFGVKALSKFYSRLNQWPQYRTQVLNLQHVTEAYPELVESIRSNKTVADDPLEISKPKTKFHSIHATSSKLQGEEPSETLKDKVLFLLNNLSASTVLSKVNGLKEIMQSKFYPWFAEHLVNQRALLEPNYHSLYLELLAKYNDPVLSEEVLNDSYTTVVALMNSEDIENSSADRSQLKNLASWIGGLTIGQNKPVLHRFIAFKDMLLEGHELNRLILVIPFSREVLKHASGSRIFSPPNPWLMGIVRLLKEFYEFADLKINLQFEIECLCRDLKLDLTSIQPSTLLRELPDKRRLMEEAKSRPNNQSTVIPNGNRTGSLPQSNVDTVELNSQRPISAQLIVSKEAELFNRHSGLKRVLQLAFDSAIREVMPPVIDRSVTIAAISTRDFVAKDFSLDGNEERLRRAAHGMVQTLVGHLTLVTCREPLRASMTSTLRAYLLQNGFVEQTLPESAINAVVSDNINLASAVIEKAGQERAIQKIDEMLAPLYAARRRHRDLRIVQPYVDPNASGYSLRFSDPLRLRANGLTPQQLSVYEEFFHAQPAAAAFNKEILSSAQAGSTQIGRDVSRMSSTGNIDGIIVDLMDLAAIARDSQFTSINMVPADHEIKLLLTHIPNAAAASDLKDELIGELAQRACLIIFSTNESLLVMEAFSLLLVRLCSVSPRTAKNVVGWLLSAEDERLYNIPATLSLLQAGLITPADMDIKLSKLILSRSKSALEFAEVLIRQILRAPVPMASKADFRRCFEASKSLGIDGTVLASYQGIVEVNGSTELSSVLDTKTYELSGLAEQLVHVLTQWIRLTSSQSDTEADRLSFIYQLVQSEILKDDEMSLLFFRTCIEHGANMYVKHSSTGLKSSAEAFLIIDGLANLVIALFTCSTDADSLSHDLEHSYLGRIMVIVVLELAKMHENTTETFNPKPFFRFFAILLEEAGQLESRFEEAILLLLNDTFLLLQPLHFPGFAFAWMSLISHRHFMPKVISLQENKGWPTFVDLLVALLRFMKVNVEGKQLHRTSRLVYDGTLRILLVLLHDFPGILLANHFTLCNNIPPNCVQVRNLVLSAFPRNMHLPDPFTQGLKVDRLSEINQSPVLTIDLESILQRSSVQEELDAYFTSQSSSDYPVTLVGRFKFTEHDEKNIDVELLNAIVLYTGMQAVKNAQSKSSGGPPTFQPKSPYMSLLYTFNERLDPEGRVTPLKIDESINKILLFNRTVSFPRINRKSITLPQQPYALL